MDLKRDVVAARKAFKNKDKKALRKSHSVHKEMHDTGSGKFLKSWVYGGLDGIVTTFAVVAGVAGASLSSVIVLIMGFANLLGDGISMAVGDYLSTKSQDEYYNRERKREEWEVDNYPKGEKDEMREIYSKRGLSKKDSETMVKILSKNKQFWVDTMMNDELGLEKSDGSAAKHGFVTFFSFLIFGLIPLSFYVIGSVFKMNFAHDFLYTGIFTGIAMFFLGSLKTRITGKNWVKSGFETLLVGGLAAGAAYLVGLFLGHVL